MMQYTFQYHSNGSCLLTGEYLVSKGSQAIVLPLKKGQTLVVKPIRQDLLIWESVYDEQTLFKAVFTTDRIDVIESTDGEKSLFVQRVLKKALEFVPSISSLPGYSIQAIHNYSSHQDPGTQAGLIASIAEWFNINPYRLNREIMTDGSYGIVCAKSSKPILYQAVEKYPDYEPIDMDWPFSENLYFVFTGYPTDHTYKRKKIEHIGDLPKKISRIREINSRIIQSRSLEAFEKALLEYEQIFSEELNERRLQERKFEDFPGVIKPLKTENSPFLLVTWKGSKQELEEYFARHNLQTLYLWDELVMYQD